MADTVASPLLGMLIHRLMSLSDKSWNLKNLQLTLAEISTLVPEAENKSEDDKALRFWLTAVRDAVYEADDVLDELDYLTANRSSTSTWLLFRRFSFVCEYLLRVRIERNAKFIHRRLDALLSRRLKYQNVDASISLEDNHSVSVGQQETFIKSDVFGREKDKKILFDQLLRDNYETQIIPIVGMGGLGKTALAQLIYNDEMVSHHFDITYWVYVGEDLKKTRDTIIQDRNSGLSLLNKGRKFLMVLDDVWREDKETWQVLRRLLNTLGAPGSVVIVTTSSRNVADMVGTVTPYTLEPLSDDDGWSLFEHVASISSGEENIKFIEMEKRLVSRCMGLPLAIKAAAGLMLSKRSGESSWMFMKDDDPWNLLGIESCVISALLPTYYRLPPHLKQCFAYCSIFPKGSKIPKEKLIELWIAEGFVQPNYRGHEEDIGNDYFMELVKRLFFVEIWRNDYGGIVSCRMHDFFHDLAQYVARVGCSILESRKLKNNIPEGVRYSSLVWDSDEKLAIPELLHKAKNLRTLLLFSSNKYEEVPEFFLKLKRLRALDLSGSGIQKLSGGVADLIHLRFLNLSRTHIETLPDSIIRLRKLNTLELVECYKLFELPRSICELTNLGRLDIQSCCSLSRMPPRIGKLKLLQILPMFILSNLRGSSSIRELEDLDIRGTLEIKNLDCVRLLGDAVQAKLVDKQNLLSLGLSWGRDSTISTEVLEELQPPMELKDLRIESYKGISYPSWMMDSYLQNLVNFSLTNCSCSKLPPLGKLPKLEYLSIKGMPGVEEINCQFCGRDGFPSLKQLDLLDMPNLYKFKLEENETEASSSSSQKAFPCLEFLTIKGCHNLSGLPEFPNLKNIALWNCNEQLLLSLDSLKSLSSLVIHRFQNPNLWIPRGKSYSLEKMTIYDSGNLLAQLDDGWECFSSLEDLRMLRCGNFRELPTGLKYLTSLRKLEIVDCPDLNYLPDSMLQLNSLEELIIDGCPMLQSLPYRIGSLPGLQKLVTRSCPKLDRQELLEMVRLGDTVELIYD